MECKWVNQPSWGSWPEHWDSLPNQALEYWYWLSIILEKPRQQDYPAQTCLLAPKNVLQQCWPKHLNLHRMQKVNFEMLEKSLIHTEQQI